MNASFRIIRSLFQTILPALPSTPLGIPVFAMAVALMITSQNSRAASATWLNTGTNATWSTSSNWVGGVAPGSNGSDIATFNTAVGTVGTSGNPVVFPAGTNPYEIFQLIFDTSNVGAFTIGTTSGPTLEFASTGGITMTSTVTSTEIINAPLETHGTTSNFSLLNNAAASSAVLVINGTISGPSTTGTSAVFLGGTNTGNNTINGVINNGSVTGSGGEELAKLGAGTWDLTAANTFTGGVLLGGGDLVLNFAAGDAQNNILPSAAPLVLGATGSLSGSFTALTNGPVATSATLTLDGSSLQSDSETLGAVTSDSRHAGAFHFDLVPGTGQTLTLTLGVLPAKETGLTIDFSIPNSNALVYVGTASTAAPTTGASNSSTTTGLFANAITINGDDFATNNGNTATALEGLSSSNLDYYAGDTDGGYANLTYTGGTASINGVNLAVDVLGNLTDTGTNVEPPAIRFNQNAGDSITVSNTKDLWTPVFLVTSNVGAYTSDINGGTLTGDNGGDLDIIQNNTVGSMEIDSAIANAANTTYLTKAGPGLLFLTGANSYTGLTFINEGTIQFENEVSLYNDTTTSWTAANINVAPGATLALNVGGPNEFTAADISTLETNFAAGTTSEGLENGSILGLDTTFATGGTFVESTALTNSANGADSVGLTKIGINTLQLTNTNTYTGPTTVQAGTLALLSSSTNNIADSFQILVGDTQADSAAILDVTGISNAGGFQVQSGQTLAGYGTVNAGSVAVTTLSGSTVSPGTTGTVGTLSITTNTLTLNQGTKFLFDLNGVGASDQLNVTGTLTLNNQQFTDFTFNTLTTVAPGQQYTLMAATTLNGTLGADTTGYVDGYMSSIDISGNDLLLEVASVPEPSTWTLLLGGMVLLVFGAAGRASLKRLPF